MVKRIKKSSKIRKTNEAPKLNTSRDQLNLLTIVCPPNQFLIESKIAEIHSALTGVSKIFMPISSHSARSIKPYADTLRMASLKSPTIDRSLNNPIQLQLRAQLNELPVRLRNTVEAFSGTGTQITSHPIIIKEKEQRRLNTQIESMIDQLVFDSLSHNMLDETVPNMLLSKVEQIVTKHRTYFSQRSNELFTNIEKPFETMVRSSQADSTIAIAIPQQFYHQNQGSSLFQGFRSQQIIHSGLTPTNSSTYNQMIFSDIEINEENLKKSFVELWLNIYFNFPAEADRALKTIGDTVPFEDFFQNLQIINAISTQNGEINAEIIHKFAFYNSLNLLMTKNSNNENISNLFDDFENIMSSTFWIIDQFNSNFEIYFEEIFEYLKTTTEDIAVIKQTCLDYLLMELEPEVLLNEKQITQNEYAEIIEDIEKLRAIGNLQIFKNQLLKFIGESICREFFKHIGKLFFQSVGLSNLDKYIQEHSVLGDRLTSELVVDLEEDAPRAFRKKGLNQSLKKYGRLDKSTHNYFLEKAAEILEKNPDKYEEASDITCRYILAEYIHRTLENIEQPCFLQATYDEKIIKIVELIDNEFFYNLIYNSLIARLSDQTFKKVFKRDIKFAVMHNQEFSQTEKTELLEFIEKL